MGIIRVFLKAKEDRELKQGFPWVFDNEIDFIKAEKDGTIRQFTLQDCIAAATNPVPDGSPAEIFSRAGQFLGTGIINKKSKIAIRIISREHIDPQKYAAGGIHAVFGYDFFRNLIEQAASLRSLYFDPEDSYRLVFAEADFIPGLVVERFCDTNGHIFLVVQFLTLSAIPGAYMNVAM
jgi:23S rRNA (cytosine1962-C5)-methyltransferase